MYPILEVPTDASDLPEQLGTKRKFWYRNEAKTICMFKEGRPNTGENWAEKVCCELCKLIGIPHADYDFAAWRDSKGVSTPKFVPERARLVLGNELLAKMIEGYPQGTRYKARQHTVTTVMSLLKARSIGMPLGYARPSQLSQANEVFLGYLMLDALVANQDRHHENWGLILLPDRAISLAPSFDHAASLGRNELDAVRMRRLNTRDKNDTVERFVERATSALYRSLVSPKPLSPLAAFQDAAKLAPKAGEFWLDRLKQTTVVDYMAIFREIPESEISEPAKRFALKMLEINRKRLLQE